MEVDFDKIKQEKVKKFLIRFGLKDSSGFKHFKPMCYRHQEAATYLKHLQTFQIKQGIERVWMIYKTIHPKEAWNGEMASFGLQYSESRNIINYIDDNYSGLEEGQIIILNLRIFLGLIHIAVAHKVSEVNDQERTIKLCYMAGGASEGSQWIKLSETADGFTEVSHLTFYKSNSRFRDTKLYPGLHSKAISEFHNNIRQNAEGLL